MMQAKPPTAGSNRRPLLTPILLNAIVTTYLLALCNHTFWGHLIRIFEGRMLLGMVFTGAIWFLIYLTISILAVRWLHKPVLIAFIMITAVSS